ncbi:MAG: pyridoxamine 5'-phosphate oxidase family protein [Streptosporangiaceae bacterium]
MSSSELSWPEIAARLAPARDYWLCTASATGEPHAVPVWGVVLGSVLHLFTARSTVKARNIASNPRVVVHLESPEDVLIVAGTAADLGAPAQVPAVVAALDAKYDDPADRAYLPSAEPSYDVIYAIEPRSAQSWHLGDFTGSQRRWRGPRTPSR